MIFALPFGLGCALCQYVLPEPWRYWTAGIAVLALLLSSLLAAASGRTAYCLTGLPGALRLLPAYSQSSSTTALAASSSL